MKQPVKDEMAVAMQRERQQHDKAGIATMVNLVDKIALRYSPELARYNCNNPTNNLCLQDYSTNPDQLPVAVPLELLGIWTYAEEPTEKEEQMYDQYLARILPVPIYSPDLPQPHVLWHKLNTNILRNMPTPNKFSIMGCSPDPEFYTAIKQTTE